ncbi:MAG: LLM class flavin-dependent oxidoreductase, partial [Acidimicrobiia bacterium]
ISPSGPKLAGRHGLGLLSLAATDPAGTERLAEHWDIMVTEGARCGHVMDRRGWRLMGPMYVAETVEQAKRDCRYGLRWVYEYLAHVSPTAIPVPDDPDDLADDINATGRGVIGTPDMAVAQIERLWERSGGYGTYLFFGADFAPYRQTLRSYELFAEEVIPRLTGHLAAPAASFDRVAAAASGAREAVVAAREAAAKQWQSERDR